MILLERVLTKAHLRARFRPPNCGSPGRQATEVRKHVEEVKECDSLMDVGPRIL